MTQPPNQAVTNGAEIRPIWATTAEILTLLDISRRTLSHLQQTNDFPKPIRLGYKLLRWNIEEVKNWIEEKENNANQKN